MNDQPVITWRPDRYKPIRGERGYAYDGEMPIGVVSSSDLVGRETEWWWGFTCTGPGVDYTRNRGNKATKEAAKAQVERLYRAFCAFDPANRERTLAHHEQGRRSAEMWEGRRDED